MKVDILEEKQDKERVHYFMVANLVGHFAHTQTLNCTRLPACKSIGTKVQHLQCKLDEFQYAPYGYMHILVPVL